MIPYSIFSPPIVIFVGPHILLGIEDIELATVFFSIESGYCGGLRIED